jgi:hypothetical protein
LTVKMHVQFVPPRFTEVRSLVLKRHCHSIFI